MKNRCCRSMAPPMFLAVACMLIVIAWPSAGAEERPAAPPDPWAKYQLILERNIFSRNRRLVRRPEDDREAPPVVVPDPETHFLLKGIVQENNEFIAFVEDTQGGTVLRLNRDDPVARGTIKALNLDGIEYQFEDRITAVKLGCDLEGNVGAVPARAPLPAVTSASAAPTSAAGQTQPAPPAGQTPAPTGDEADILKRLMEQRRQQLGQ
jgi:hypothetical protein